MAELATAARPYAEALFCAVKAGNLGAWSKLVSEMGQIATAPDIKAVADDPKLSEANVAGTFPPALRSSVSYEAKGLVGLLVVDKCPSLLPEVVAQFHVLRNASEGAADVEITSAFPLGGAPLTELVATLERKFGEKLQVHMSVDSSLIGGVRVQIGSEVLDTPACVRLTQMQSALTAA